MNYFTHKSVVLSLFSLALGSSMPVFASNFELSTGPIFQIVSSVQKNDVRSDTVTAVSLFTVTNKTPSTIPDLTVDPTYQDGNLHLSGVSLNNDNCTGTTLLSGKSCTFQVLVDGPTISDVIALKPRVCGFTGAICSKPVGFGVIVTKHPIVNPPARAYLGVEQASPGNYMQPIVTTTNVQLAPVYGFQFNNTTLPGYSQGISVSTDGGTVYAANADGEGSNVGNVKVYDVASNTIVYSISNAQLPGYPTTPISFVPAGLMVSPDGKRLYIADVGPYASGTNKALYVFDVTNPSQPRYIYTVSLKFTPHGVAVSSDGNQVYVTSVSSSTAAVIDTIKYVPAYFSTDANTLGVVLSHDGSTAYFTTGNPNAASSSDGVRIISTATLSSLGFISMKGPTQSGTGPHGISIGNDDRTLFVADQAINYVSIITNLAAKDNATVTYQGTSNCSKPLGVAVAPDNSKVYISCNGTSTSPPFYFAILDRTNNNIVTSVSTNGNQTTFGNFIG